MNFERMMKYLAELEVHNNREWFHATHGEYEAAKKDFEELVTLLREEAAMAAPEMADRMRLFPVRQMIFRTARDMRRGGDRPPYKPWFGASLSDEGREKKAMCFYVQICPGNRSEIGIGIWYCDDRALTDRVRRYIINHGAEFENILSDKEVGGWFAGEKLTRLPKGFSADEPYAEWAKYKQWMLNCPVPDEKLTDFASFAAYAGSVFRKMEPMRAFLCRAQSEQPEEPETGDEDETEDITGTEPVWEKARSADEWDF